MAARRRTTSLSGYYFTLEDSTREEGVLVYITDAEYFDRTGFQSDWHISGVVAIPTWLHEESEGVFGSDYNRLETAQGLFQAGFRASTAFTNRIRSSGRNVIETEDLLANRQPVRDSNLNRVSPRTDGRPEISRARPWYERFDKEDE